MPFELRRRRFLALAAGAAGAAFLDLPRLPAGEPERHGGFLIGIQSYSLRGFPVDEAIRHAKDIGFGSLEFFESHLSVGSSDEQIEAMKAKVQDYGMKLLGHGVNGFGSDHEANRKVFEFAKKAGIRNISADPSPDSFESLDKLVAEYDIRIAIHNHGPKARYDKMADVLHAVENPDPRTGACADLGHYIRSGEDPIEAIRVLGNRLFGIHLKDFAEQKAETMGVILGKGHLNVDGVFQALRQVKFPADGSLSLEYEEKPENPLDDIRECFAIAKEAALKTAS